jgi:hypothetical protein
MASTSLGGLSTAATTRGGKHALRQQRSYPAYTANNNAVTLGGGRGAATRTAYMGEARGGGGGGGVGCAGGGYEVCRDGAADIGVGVAGGNAGNGVGGARDTRRKLGARSASQRRQASAEAVDGGNAESSSAGAFAKNLTPP